jgi:ribosomal protein S18 acetylase RimI-like enzyme
MTTVRALAADELARATGALAELLVDAVHDGASVGFLAGLDRERATLYWRDVAAEPKGRVVLIAEDAAGIVGVVIVAPIPVEVQPHRAEIFKLIVHRRARGRGLGERLMRAAEAEACAMGRRVLSLYTRHGSDGERLYARLGWTRAGIIPDDSLKPDGTLCDAAIFYKRLAERPRGAAI